MHFFLVIFFFLIGKGVNVLEKVPKQRLEKYKRGETNPQSYKKKKKTEFTNKTSQRTYNTPNQ